MFRELNEKCGNERPENFCEVDTLRDPSGYPSGGSPLIGTVTPGPNWPFLSPP